MSGVKRKKNHYFQFTETKKNTATFPSILLEAKFLVFKWKNLESINFQKINLGILWLKKKKKKKRQTPSTNEEQWGKEQSSGSGEWMQREHMST